MLTALGTVMYVAGSVMVGGGLVVGVEEALGDLLRPIRQKELNDDVREAVIRASRHADVVNIVVF